MVHYITEQLQFLVKHLLPPTLKKESQQKYTNYLLRILSSRITSSVNDKELIEKIKKQISKLNTKRTVSDPLWRFQVHLEKLLATKSTTKQFALLYCLYLLSEDPLSVYLQPTIQSIKPPAKDSSEPMIITEELKVAPTKRIGTVNEDELLRNLLYVFQDIDGNLISYSQIDEMYIITPSVIVPEGTRKMILELCELGWFYKRIMNYLHKHSNNIHEGQVVQSFCSGIQTELNEYFRLLTVLEKQLQDNPTQTADKKLDIVKLYVWMQDTIQRMKYLAIICDISQSNI